MDQSGNKNYEDMAAPSRKNVETEIKQRKMAHKKFQFKTFKKQNVLP
jgi:hypothetical protein